MVDEGVEVIGGMGRQEDQLYFEVEEALNHGHSDWMLFHWLGLCAAMSIALARDMARGSFQLPAPSFWRHGFCSLSGGSWLSLRRHAAALAHRLRLPITK